MLLETVSHQQELPKITSLNKRLFSLFWPTSIILSYFVLSNLCYKIYIFIIFLCPFLWEFYCIVKPVWICSQMGADKPSVFVHGGGEVCVRPKEEDRRSCRRLWASIENLHCGSSASATVSQSQQGERDLLSYP